MTVTILLVLACVFLLLAALNVPSAPEGKGPYVSFGWLGMFFFVLTFIWGKG